MADTAKSQTILEVFPYLRCRGAEAAIEFYRKVFGAVETYRLAEPGGKIGHAQIKLGQSVVMLSDEYVEKGILSPVSVGGTGSCLHMHVTEVDALIARAVEHGAKVTYGPQDQFYGERTAKFVDPFGHEWMLGQHIEDVSEAEAARRYKESFEKK